MGSLKLLSSRSAFIGLLVAIGSLGPSPSPSGGADIPSDVVEKLILQLGDQDAGKRDAAQNRLIEIGWPAWGSLSQATVSSDLEIAVRARRILEEIKPIIGIPVWNDTATAPTNGNMATAQVGDPIYFFHSRSNLLVARDVTDGIGLTGLPHSAWGARGAAPRNAAAAVNIFWMAATGKIVLTGQNNNQITAYDTSNGSAKWTFQDEQLATNTATQPAAKTSYDLSMPCIVGDSIYVASTTAVCSLQLASGKLNWIHKFTGKILAHPVAWNDKILLSGTKEFYIFDCKTGEDGTLALETENYSAPAISGDTAYVATKEGLAAYDLKTGKRLWLHDAGLQEGPKRRLPVVGRKLPSYIPSGLPTPIVHGDCVYYSTMNSLYAIQCADGNAKWSWKAPGVQDAIPPNVLPGANVVDRYPAFTAPIFPRESMLVVATAAGLYAIDSNVGLPAWEFHPEGKIDSMRLGPAIVSGNLIDVFFCISGRNPVGSSSVNAHMYALPLPLFENSFDKSAATKP